MKTNSRQYLIVIIFILLFIVIILSSLDSNNVSYQDNNVFVQDVNSKFTNNVDRLRIIIDKENDVEMLDVYHAIGRLTDVDIFEYSFYAFKDPKGNGYIGILSGIKSPMEV